jgi:hypothetical protein
MIPKEKLLFLVTGLFLVFSAFSQEKATLYGNVTDSTGSPVSLVNITLQGTKFGCSTDKY